MTCPLLAIRPCLMSHVCRLTCDWTVVSFRQSAELQKKLHHLEVQLNDEKQHMGDLEHKYRCGAHVTSARTQDPRGDGSSNPHSDHFMTQAFKSFSEMILLQSCKGAVMSRKRALFHFLHSCICCPYSFCRSVSNRLEKIIKELEEEVS